MNLLNLLVPVFLSAQLAAQVADSKEPPPLPEPSKIKPTMYCTGFAFAEGPAIDRDGNLYVVNYREWGTIGKITPDGAASILVNLHKALPPPDGAKAPSCNGLKIDDDGNLIGAETGTSQIIRISKDGKKVDVLAREVDGVRLSGLNDVALDQKGNIYFSNPGQHNVYRINRDGSIDRLNPEPIGSNGIGVTPDGKHLVTADSEGMRLMILDLVDGEGQNQRELISFKPTGTPDELGRNERQKLADKVGVPDGFVFDEFGRLYVGMWTGKVVHVVEVPSGKLLATYAAGGSQATNVHFFNGDLYITVAANEAVYKLPLGIRGWRYSKGCGY